MQLHLYRLLNHSVPMFIKNGGSFLQIMNTFMFIFLLILLWVLSYFIVTSHVPTKNILVALPKLLFKDFSHLDIGRLLFLYKPCHFYLPFLFAEGITKEKDI